MSDFDKSMAHEALDRIHVIQQMLATILVQDAGAALVAHKGLCSNAINAIENAQQWLSEAYALQSEVVDE